MFFGQKSSPSQTFLSQPTGCGCGVPRCGALCFKLKQFDPASGSICCLAGSQSNQVPGKVTFLTFFLEGEASIWKGDIMGLMWRIWCKYGIYLCIYIYMYMYIYICIYIYICTYEYIYIWIYRIRYMKFWFPRQRLFIWKYHRIHWLIMMFMFPTLKATLCKFPMFRHTQKLCC